jgi:hypothetical protein
MAAHIARRVASGCRTSSSETTTIGFLLQAHPQALFFFNGRRKYACKCSLTIAWIEKRPCLKRSCTEASIIIGPHAGAEIDLRLLLTFNPTKQGVRIKGVARHAHKGTTEHNGEQQNLFATRESYCAVSNNYRFIKALDHDTCSAKCRFLHAAHLHCHPEAREAGNPSLIAHPVSLLYIM